MWKTRAKGRWTIQEAIDHNVPAPVITASLYERFHSRQPENFAAKVIASLRNEFGGHAVKSVEGTVHDATGSGDAVTYSGTSDSTADQIQPGASASEAAETIAATEHAPDSVEGVRASFGQSSGETCTAAARTFPIALMIASFLFDALAYVGREPYKRDLHVAGFYTLLLGAPASFVAVFCPAW